jgi:hypothetical protein
VTGLEPLYGVGFMRKLVELQRFEDCIGRWNWPEPGEYFVTLRAGTTGDALRAWSIRASRGDRSFRLELPR